MYVIINFVVIKLNIAINILYFNIIYIINGHLSIILNYLESFSNIVIYQTNVTIQNILIFKKKKKISLTIQF